MTGPGAPMFVSGLISLIAILAWPTITDLVQHRIWPALRPVARDAAISITCTAAGLAFLAAAVVTEARTHRDRP